MTYSEKLRDPRWQKKRLEILNRDEWECVLCGDTTLELHVHHKRYSSFKEPWEYDDENFMSLCKDCHKIIEFYKDSFELIGIGKRGRNYSLFIKNINSGELLIRIIDIDEYDSIKERASFDYEAIKSYYDFFNDCLNKKEVN